MEDSERIPAGSFSQWLREAEASLRSGKRGVDVPCGGCTACCRASLFIHIRPEETRTLERIPPALLFPAPSLPIGHMVMGYDERGRCPMLVDDRCSIYENRPQTCRGYDCRILAAAGATMDEPTQADIARRVRAWDFHYESAESREEQRMVREAAAFLEEHRDLFPPSIQPAQPASLAALAVRICRLFDGTSRRTDADLARAILERLSEPAAE